MSQGKCRDCGKTSTVSNWEWVRAFQPRCPGCGGLLDKQKFKRPKKRKPGKPAKYPVGSRRTHW